MHALWLLNSRGVFISDCLSSEAPLYVSDPPTTQAKPVVAAEDLPKTIGPQITVAHNPILPRKATVIAQHSPAPPPRTTPITPRAAVHDANNTYDTVDIDMPDFPREEEVEPKPATKHSVGWPAKPGGRAGPRDSGYSPGSGANSSSSSSQSPSPQEVKGRTSGDAGGPRHFMKSSTPLAQPSPIDDHTYCVPPDTFLDHTYDTPPTPPGEELKLPLEEEMCETTFDEDTLDPEGTGQPCASGGQGVLMASIQSQSSALEHTASPQGEVYTVVKKEKSASNHQRAEEEDDDSLPSTFKPRRKAPQVHQPPTLTPSNTSSPGSSPLPAHTNRPTDSPELKAPVNRKAEQMAELKRLPSIHSMRLQLQRRMTGGEIESPASPQGSPPTTPRRISIPEAVQNLPPGPPIGVSNPPPAAQPKEAPVKKKHSFKILRRSSKKEEAVAVPAPIEEGSRQPTSVQERRRSLRVATPISPTITSQQVGEFQNVFQSITKTQSPSVHGYSSAPRPTSDGSVPMPMTLTAYSSSQPDVNPTSNSAFQSAGHPASLPLSQPAHTTLQSTRHPQSNRYPPASQVASQRGAYTAAHGGRPGPVTRPPMIPEQTSSGARRLTANPSSYPLSLNQIVPGLSSPAGQQTAPPTGISHLQRASTLPHLHSKSSSLQGKVESIAAPPMNTKRDKKRKSFRRRKTESTFK